MKFVWVWRHYTFRGEQVLVVRTRQAESCIDRAFRKSQYPNDPPLPDIVTFECLDGTKREVTKPDFLLSAELIARE